ncbi:MAG: DUF87 domain-containing protein [Alphaproteobacteria bacterium]|nr:DUF87 domain-containing protein [Alphaproteobacteria bacterium]
MPDLGTSTDGAPVDVDFDRLIGSHLAIVANSGAGKSWAIRKLAELAAERMQRIILDPEDEFYTLREQQPSMILAGGPNGDCPLPVGAEAEFARFLLRTGLDAVLQLNDLGPERAQAFVAGFLAALIAAPPDLWHPALIVVDEVQTFAPQHGMTGSRAAVELFMAQARKRGFTGVLASQRMATVSKSAIAPANNWLLGRVGHATDRAAIAGELGFGSRSREAIELRSLEDGQFWAFGPALAREPVTVRIGGTVTRHPQRGKRDIPTPPAPDRIREMLAQLQAESVQEPIVNASPAGGADGPDKAEIAAAERLGYERGLAEGRRLQAADDAEKIGQMQAAITGALEYLGNFVEQRGDDIPVLNLRPTTPPTIEHQAEPHAAAALPPASAPRRSRAQVTAEKSRSAANTLTGPQRRILDAVAWWEAAGISPGTRVQVAVAAGYSPRGSAFTNPLGALRAGGLIDYPTAGEIALTATGRSTAVFPDRRPSTVEFHERLYELLPGPQRRILTAVIASYPAAIDRETLAAKTGYSPNGSAFTNPLGALRGLGLVDYPQPGQVAARPILFVDKKPRVIGGRHG